MHTLQPSGERFMHKAVTGRRFGFRNRNTVDVEDIEFFSI